jgi:hypothetical protein
MYDDSRHDVVKRFFRIVEITITVVIWMAAVIGAAAVVWCIYR